MELGVQTHFSQGWNASLVAKAAELGATSIRDSVSWGAVEKTAGTYTYAPQLVDYLGKAQAVGMDALLTFASGNALYDSGLTPFTAAGRQAYANYIVDVLKKYGGEVTKIEIWNEFNLGQFTGEAAKDPSGAYTALLKTVYETVKPLFPSVQILGGSTNVIGTGALDAIFKLGALDYMDGVVVHPYRTNAEHVDDELNHLNDVMASYGNAKPIYATEFGNQFDDAADVPSFMLKMVTAMSSAHVKEAYWYDLVDESFFKNMGLYTSSGQAKPAADTFAFVEKTLLPLGDAVKIDTGDPDTLIYRFGTDTYVMWGAGRAVKFAAGGTIYDAQGHAIAAPTTLSADPIVFKGAGYALGEDLVMADSLYGFDTGQFTYYAQSKGVLTALTNVDWNWTSYLGSKYTKPLRVNADSIAPAGDGANPINVVERYTSDRAQKVLIDGSWTTSGSGDGIDLHILVNGKEVLTRIVNGTFTLDDFAVTLAKGDTVDFVVGPNQYVQGDSTWRHITITQVPETSVALASRTPAAAVVAAPAPLSLVGTAAADTLTGGALGDWLSGLGGDDVLSGGAGNDVLDGGIGKNRIAGGDGIDTVSYASQTAAVKVTLGIETAQKVNATTTDTLQSIEAVIGSAFDDTFSGSAADERFDGAAGNDTFNASAGHDVVIGGAGTDTLSFATWTKGVAVSLAATGVQALDATSSIQLSGIEVLTGGSGNDVLTAAATGSTLNGGAGDDLLVGGAGNDVIDGGAGTNTVSYADATSGVSVSLAISTAQDTLGAGLDTLRRVQGLTGSAFADTLTGSANDDVLSGGAGNDVLAGGKGADILWGGTGADQFVFRGITDSAVATADTIMDFSHAEGDRIDLSAIDASTTAKGDNAFVLASAFTKIAGQLVLKAETGGWLVSGDVNGDGVADFAIHVHSATALSAADFIL